MATLAQVRKRLKELNLELDEDVSYWARETGGNATIDTIGRMTIDGDCRGHYVYDYTATRAEFWQLVLDEAEHVAETLSPCPHPVGECEFHDFC